MHGREKKVTVIVVLWFCYITFAFCCNPCIIYESCVGCSEAEKGKSPKIVFVVCGAIAKFPLTRRKIDILD